MHSEAWTVDVAATYDDDIAEMFLPEALAPAVDFLAELVAGRRVLEFAVGSGRVALALAARGVEVVGIELSQPMIDVMRAKPGNDRIRVTCGDMATTRVAGTFGVVYLVFNTITAVSSSRPSCLLSGGFHSASSSFHSTSLTTT